VDDDRARAALQRASPALSRSTKRARFAAKASRWAGARRPSAATIAAVIGSAFAGSSQ
jgi:hypothetical protein